MPQLQMSSRWIACYVDNWGADWVEGPLEATLDAIHKILPRSDDKAVYSLTNASSLFKVLGEFKTHFGRTPLIIFDQVDDYQSRHKKHFLLDNSFIQLSQLLSENLFWRELKELLDQGRLGCIFGMRSDAAAGLECLRLGQPRVYSLDRLPPGFVLPLLEQLTSSGSVISHSDNGWTDLSRQLAADLERDGSVLPIQLRMALRALSALPTLTVREYRLHGGLLGLEVSHIQFQFRETSRNFGVREDDLRHLLMSMVSRDDKRSVTRSENDLQKACAGTSIEDWGGPLS